MTHASRPTRTAAGTPLRVLALAAAAALGAFGTLTGTPPSVQADGGKARTPIEHFVVLMQENHTFDNYFGTFPGAEGPPDGTCIPRDPNQPSLGCVEPYHLESLKTVDLHHGRSIGLIGRFGSRAR